MTDGNIKCSKCGRRFVSFWMFGDLCRECMLEIKKDGLDRKNMKTDNFLSNEIL